VAVAVYPPGHRLRAGPVHTTVLYSSELKILWCVKGWVLKVLAGQRHKAGGLRKHSRRAVEVGESGREGGDR
jgi:hypothetical protein